MTQSPYASPSMATVSTAARRRPGIQRRRGTHQRRGALLLVVLMILSVLALVAASFSYRMDAERMGIEAIRDLQQARLAAESGLARTLLLLRSDRTDMDKWYRNPDAFRRVPVWMPDDEDGIGGTESMVRKEPVPNMPAWRYSVVAYDQLNDEKVVMRYGLTDEAGKLNINFASRGELLRLVNTLKLDDTPPEALVDALIDWRDKDSELVTPAGAETPWYMSLTPSYRAKNRPFDSIDELLMVRNWNGQFLWGEDHNRNGYLDENEDDGEEGAFPPDNGDGKLERGLARLITVHSWDWNFANDNKPRDDINSLNWAELDKLPEHLQEELAPEVIDFLAQAKERGFKFRSVGELWGLEVYEDGSSNYDDAWKEYQAQVKKENALPAKDEEGEAGEDTNGEDRDGENGEDREGENGEDGEGDAGEDDGERADGESRDDEGSEDEERPGDDRNGGRGGRNGRDRNGGARDDAGDRGGDRNNGDDELDDETSAAERKAGRRNQAVRDDDAGGADVNAPGGRPRGRAGGRADGPPDGAGTGDREGETGRGRGRGGRDAGPDGGNDDGGDGNGRGRGRGRGGNGGLDGPGGRDGEGDLGDNGDGAGSQPEGDGEDDESRKGTPITSPVTPEQMNIVMDRLTTARSAVRVGQINVNTAPVEVLQTLIGMTAEEADSIVQKRQSMAGPDKLTPAWLVTSGTLTPQKFAVLANKLTGRSIQFSADVIGFADHVGTFRRIQVIIEMRGHMAQVRYYRDISGLGIGYPVQDDERSEGFAFGNE